VTQLYWRGLPVPSRRVRIRISRNVPASWWCAPLAGQERDALELQTAEGPLLIDDEDGVGTAVMSNAYKSHGGYSRLPADSEVLAELPPIGDSDRDARPGME